MVILPSEVKYLTELHEKDKDSASNLMAQKITRLFIESFNTWFAGFCMLFPSSGYLLAIRTKSLSLLC